MREKSFSEYIEFLKAEKKSFKVHISRNSQIVFLGEKKIVFNRKKLNPRIFHISKELKYEADLFLHYNPDFFKGQERGSIKYYNYNRFPKKLKRFYFIDITSCYITCLVHNNVISHKLFNKVNSLPKKDRLIGLGMLAYEPYEIIYTEGIRDKAVKRVTNEYSPVFYYACYLTQVLIEKLIKKIDNRYIWYWVDGIFFKDISEFNLISDKLKSLGFKFKFGSCYNLKVRENKNYYNLNFKQFKKGNKIKGDKNEFDKLEPKIYNIPNFFEDYIEKKENYKLIINEDFSKLINNYKRNNFGEIK